MSAEAGATAIPPSGGEALRVLGELVYIKLTGAQTSGLFSLFELVNGPGTGVPPHVHAREDEVFYVVEGRVAFTIDGKALVAEAGASLHLPRGAPHGFQVSGDGPARIVAMVFPAGIEQMFRELAVLPPGPPDLARVAEICGRHGITLL